MKVVQILISHWIGNQGTNMEDILGLGDDGNIYKWHKATGTWILNVINSR